MFAVNHLAPYLLTRLLTPRLRDSAPSRVVVVASGAYRFDRLDPEDDDSERGFSPMKVYGRSKLCNLLLAAELQRRIGDRVAVSIAHPGFVSTGLGRDNRVADAMLKVIRPLIRTHEKGARTSVMLATEPVMAARLWDDSARLVGLEP